MKDTLVACVDGLSGFPEAVHAVFLETEIQLCIIHQIRNTMKYVALKEQREFMNDLKKVYRAPDEASAYEALMELKEAWAKKYGMVLDSWVNKWDKLSTYFRYGEGIRKIIYTTYTDKKTMPIFFWNPGNQRNVRKYIGIVFLCNVSSS